MYTFYKNLVQTGYWVTLCGYWVTVMYTTYVRYGTINTTGTSLEVSTVQYQVVDNKTYLPRRKFDCKYIRLALRMAISALAISAQRNNQPQNKLFG
jgi:hypothetical protein